MAGRQAMSMEAMLDEERKEVLALLEGTNARPRPPSSLEGRSPSPYTPRSPVRSMLDIGDDPPSPTLLSPVSPKSFGTKTRCALTAPVRSMLDVDSPPPPKPVRSMLDVDSPPATKQVLSTPSSPTDSNARAQAANNAHPRSMSDASARPVDFGPRLGPAKADLTSEYQFSGIITNHVGQALPKRVTQGGKRPGGMPDQGNKRSSAMAEIMRGNDISGLVLPGDRGRHHSASGPSMRPGNKSKSPTSRSGMRSHSPRGPLLRNLSPAAQTALNDPEIADYNNAYRRLSDAALARSGGSLSELGKRKPSNYMTGTGRLAKDYLSPDGELLVEDSSEDDGSSSGEEGQRGRKAARPEKPDGQRQAKSLLAAAEEERIQVASQKPYQYRSLLDEPEITVTNPSGERVKQHKPFIHPTTSFDDPPGTGTHTPMDSDTEADLTDIKRAQKLSFAMTQIMDTPEAHRTIQIITRGEYSKLVQDAEEEHRPPRKYLVATDLSDESTHALEWAIGTVLRDGDTLLAIYCVDEETGIGASENAQVPDEPKAMKEQAAAINTVTSSKTPITPSGTDLPLRNQRPWPLLSNASDAGTTSSVSPAPSIHRERSKAEEDRYKTVQGISERVTKLLRKTRLQVRVIVEVLHCKNPKHLITEVIDLVNPTLVILGSRGRSALKGVILGSFSNYLVTKSSVPVMVARKRLRKQGKYKRVPSTHQINNIHNPAARSLASAKID
jgi:nucleotide-binding universal stress UspA family protein